MFTSSNFSFSKKFGTWYLLHLYHPFELLIFKIALFFSYNHSTFCYMYVISIPLIEPTGVCIHRHRDIILTYTCMHIYIHILCIRYVHIIYIYMYFMLYTYLQVCPSMNYYSVSFMNICSNNQ